MTDLQIFNNPEFGEIRTLEDKEEVLFCAADVARALGYSNPRDAIRRHCKKGVAKHDILSNGGMQSFSFIPKGDVYRLIAHSKLPAAEKFESWVFDEVLPTIHKHGAYMTPDKLEVGFLTVNSDFCEFGKEVKKRLVDIEQTQSWLAEKVSEDTGLWVDTAYLSNTLAGRRTPKKIMTSIKKILEME